MPGQVAPPPRSAASRPTDDGRRFFLTLDGIRGIAALLVVLRHTTAFFGPVGFEQSYLAVDIFFLLSGVVICQAYEDRLRAGLSWTGFLVIRLIRLYPLYALGMVVAAIAKLVEGSGGEHLGAHLVASLLMVPNPNKELILPFPLNGPAWSVFLELVVNLVYAAALPALTTRRVALIVGASAAGLFAAGFLFHQAGPLDLGWTVRTTPGGLLRVTFSFFLGVLICRRFQARHGGTEMRRSSAGSAALVLVVGLLLVAPPVPGARLLADLAVVIVAFPLIVVAGLFVQPGGAVAALFRLLGAISYAIYALHEPVGRLVAALAVRVAGFDVGRWAPWGGFALLAGLIVLCWAADAVYDNPVRRWLSRRLAPSRAETPPAAARRPRPAAGIGRAPG